MQVSHKHAYFISAVIKKLIYMCRAFTEEPNCVTVLPSACGLEMPPSSAKKKGVMRFSYYATHY
jgi:hypothetical protein